MFAAIGGLIVALLTAWMHGCALVGNCRCGHLENHLPKSGAGGA
jgi:hypothetical protein